jgi:hypothetical protein
MQYQGFVFVELSSIIYKLAGVEEYVSSLKQGDLMAVSRFVESGRINIDAAVIEVCSSILSDFLRINANSCH